MTRGRLRMKPMTRERSTNGHRTQWTAQFLVAAELARRGYTVAFTMGNRTPVADLMVAHVSERGVQFLVNVKGLAGRSTWLVEREGEPIVKDLYYILVSVGARRSEDQFFILSQAEVREEVLKEKKRRGGKGALDPRGFQGFPFHIADPFKDRWERLPHWNFALPSPPQEGNSSYRLA